MWCKRTKGIWSRSLSRVRRGYTAAKFFKKAGFEINFSCLEVTQPVLLCEQPELRLALGGRGLKQLHHYEEIREGRVSWVPLQPRATHLFHFNSPHWATNVDDKQDVFGNWVHVLRSKEVDKISIKYLKNRTCVSRTITSVWHVGGWGSGDWQGSRDHGEQEAGWP